jgi:hypothetical protein
MPSPLRCVVDPALDQVLERMPVPFGSPPRVVVKTVLSPTKKGKPLGPSSPVKPQASKPKVGAKRRLLDLDEPSTAIAAVDPTRFVRLVRSTV